MLDQLATDSSLLQRPRDRGFRQPNAPEPADDLSEESLFDSSPSVAAEPSVVRQLAGELRDELHKFVHSNLSAPPKMGFNCTGHDPVSVDALTKACESAVRKLEEIITDDSGATPAALNERVIASAMQGNVEEFLVGIVRRSSSDGLTDGELDVTLQAAIALKQQLGGSMVQLDAMKAGFQIG